MMPIYYFVAAVLATSILKWPYIGIVLIFTFVTFQGVIGDWLESSELFFAFLGVTTVISYVFKLLNGYTSFHISPTAILILAFAFFILGSNPDAALHQNRNWFLTYIQLFV